MDISTNIFQVKTQKSGTMLKVIITLFFIHGCFVTNTEAYQQNKTSHHVHRDPEKNVFFKKMPSYRSFQPVSIKYHRPVYPKNVDRMDYTYDTEYGGVVSNFTSSIYDDNPPIYPNPELLTRNEEVLPKIKEQRAIEVPREDIVPDNSLADGDLKDHNIIDSVTYLYGFNNCHVVRAEWMVLIFIGSGITVALLTATVVFLVWSERAKHYRENSRLYPLVINLCTSMQACSVIYVRAVMGVTSPAQCEKVALLLHYTYLICSMWIVLIAGSVVEYSTNNTMMSLKYHYLLAYGVPAIAVMFNYALSMEQYEIKHYCWMSIEKGMVMGFMVPAMVLILINTGIVIIGLQSVNKKQAEHLTAKIQELVDHHIANWPKEQTDDRNGSIDTLDLCTPGSSRKNTDTSDTMENNFSEDECHYVSMVVASQRKSDPGVEPPTNQPKPLTDKSLLNMLYLDNLSWKSAANSEVHQLKTYLNLCLVMEPFFAVNWVMGVVAVENATYWPTPTLYLILMQVMHIYLAVTLCTTLPVLRDEKVLEATCEEVISEPVIAKARTTDSIPLLDPTVQQPIITPAPADSISTISI